jgi:hypothetical protein
VLGKQTVSNPISVAKFVLELSIPFLALKHKSLPSKLTPLTKLETIFEEK